MITSNYKDDIVFARFLNYLSKTIVCKKIDYDRKNKPVIYAEIHFYNNEWETINEESDCYSIYDKICSYSFNDNYMNKLNLGLDKLSKKQRKVIDLYYYENMSDSDIAKYMSITKNAVEKLKIRALKSLKEFFEEEINRMGD